MMLVIGCAHITIEEEKLLQCLQFEISVVATKYLSSVVESGVRFLVIGRAWVRNPTKIKISFFNFILNFKF